MVHIGQKHGGQPLLKVKPNCDSLTSQRAKIVAPSDRAAETGAISVKRTPQPGTFSWVIFSRSVTARPSECHHKPLSHPHHPPLLARKQSRKATP